jgi:hypothetical protein
MVLSVALVIRNWEFVIKVFGLGFVVQVGGETVSVPGFGYYEEGTCHKDKRFGLIGSCQLPDRGFGSG